MEDEKYPPTNISIRSRQKHWASFYQILFRVNLDVYPELLSYNQLFRWMIKEYNSELFNLEGRVKLLMYLINWHGSNCHCTAEMGLERYKIVVQAVIGEQKDQGFQFASKCFWDPDTDDYSFGTFVNDKVFGVVGAWAMYLTWWICNQQ